MPTDSPRDNPFAPPEAPLGRPEPEASADPIDRAAPYVGPDVIALFLRWEGARLAYNGAVALTAIGLWGVQTGDYPRDPTIALLIVAVLVNLGFCVGPILAAVGAGESGRSWSESWAASLLCVVGMALTLGTVGLMLGGGLTTHRPA